MRFMLLMIPHGYETAPPGTIPDDVEAVGAMMACNESMQKAGILISCDGLHPPSMGARVSFPGRKPKPHEVQALTTELASMQALRKP